MTARCPQFCTFRGRSPRCIRCGLPPRDPRTLALPAAHDPPEPARECLLPAFLVGLALETPSTPEELLRIARVLGVDPNRLRFARYLAETGLLSG